MFEALQISPESLTSSSDSFESDGQSIRLETPALPLKTDDRPLERTSQSTIETARQPLTIAPRSFEGNLVTVHHIARIKRIKNPDKKTQKLAILSLDGLTVVTHNRDAKTKFKVNDLVVFIEADSFLPIGSSSSLAGLISNSNAGIEIMDGQKGYRVKPPVIGNHISDGLVYRLDEIPEIHEPYRARVLELGGVEATTELLSASFDSALGVQRWKFAPEMALALGHGPNAPSIVGLPPYFLLCPTWQRAQDRPSIFKPVHWRARETMWQITEKLDGERMHVYKVASERYLDYIPTTSNVFSTPTPGRREHVGICSRTHEYADDGQNQYSRVARESGILDKIRRIPYPNIDVQGELVRHTPDDDEMDDALRQVSNRFFVFGIWDIDRGAYLEARQTEEICKQLGIDHVPVLDYAPVTKHAKNTEELVAYANGPSRLGGLREGLVFKSLNAAEGFRVISSSWLDARERHQ
ncbi:RNA ligase-domain-containing protein [Cercophora scortea]|uniref:RNA ligase-domain-containing protein n=1 Tax=Cercophora scortea TaxID=314031 RepID=A0AAE0J2M8_9PEZI|nr:RNA ligase-domain-containing protein [Cercophora scortea]